MTVKMELELEQEAARLILAELKKVGQPARATELLRQLARAVGSKVSELALRRAIWYLLDKGEIELTPENRIQVKKPALAS